VAIEAPNARPALYAAGLVVTLNDARIQAARLASAVAFRSASTRQTDATPRQLPDQLAEFAKIAEVGPNHEVDGVVRWRRIDLKRVIPTNSASSFTGSPIQTVDISALE
jgi:hypothetical protein